MIGHRTERYTSFGWAAARLDDLVNLVPARLSALFLSIAAPHSGRWVGPVYGLALLGLGCWVACRAFIARGGGSGRGAERYTPWGWPAARLPHLATRVRPELPALLPAIGAATAETGPTVSPGPD